jgi:solute carrier family 35 (UDP-sugar transporter), member A1/2/3
LKWISLIILVIQNATTILLLRYVRTASGDLFFSTTAIVCQEILKVLVSIVLLYLESNSFAELCNQINQQIIKNPFDSIKTGIPAFLFTIQTNLVYLAISNLDAAVFQVTFQIKILTTALFTVILLNRSLRCSQWLSLVLLCIGISIIQIQNVSSQSSSGEDHKNALYGLFCVILACVLSGLAGVYFEKILKNSKVSIWVRNIQLGLFGTFFALLTAFSTDYDKIQLKGFFFGYNKLVWTNIVIQSSGGLLVAVVIKYADNILKGFATSIAIIVSCLASAYLFNTVIDFIFAFGTLLVVLSVMLYSYVPPNNSASVSESTSQTSSLSSSPKQLLVNEKNENFSKLINDSTIDLIQYKLNNNNNVSIEMNSK